MKARILFMLVATIVLLTQNVRANTEDDFAAPFDFEDEMTANEKPIPLPKEKTRKMASKPLVIKPAPVKKISNNEAAIKRKQAQALKRISDSSRSSHLNKSTRAARK